MKRRDLCFWLSAISLMGVLAGCEDTSSGVTGYILKCTPGEIKCEAGQLQTCVGTSWYTIPCPSNECLEDGSSCKLLNGQICTPGQQLCSSDGSSILTCDANGENWQSAPCTKGKCNMSAGKVECSDEDDILECNPNDIKCSDDLTATVTCNSQNKWGESIACPEATPVCDPKQKKCVEAGSVTECTDGEIKCSPDHTGIIVCNDDNTWGEPVTCPVETPVCDDELKTCVEAGGENCTDGEIKCSSDHTAIITCNDDNTWGEPVLCPVDTPVCDDELKTCVESGSVTDCTDGEIKCSSDHTAIITCNDDNTWGEPVLCPVDTPVCDDELKTCVEAGSVTDCSDGEIKCSSDHTAIIVCNDDNTWGEPVLCPVDTPVCDDKLKTCVEAGSSEKCDVGEIKCSDDHMALLTCQDDQTWKTDLCLDNYICDDEKKQCMPKSVDGCTEGDAKCSDNHLSLLRCQDNTWTEIPCVENYLCNDDNKKCMPGSVHECTPDEIKCVNDNQYITCMSNETWDYELKTCPKSRPYCDYKTNECISNTPACEDGVSYCSPDLNYVFHCNAGTIVVKDDCLSQNKVCDPATVSCKDEPVVVCNPDEVFCMDRTDGSGTDAYVCNVDGTEYKLLEECDPNKEYCLHGKGCVPLNFDCTPPETKCHDDYSYVVCGDYGWGLPNYCSKNEICKDGHCVSTITTCTEDDNYCYSEYEIMKCQADGTMALEKCPEKTPMCDKRLVQCVPEGSVTDCTPGEAYCDANKYVYCNSTGYWESKICNDDEKCYSTLGCVGTAIECNPGDAYCKDNNLHLCSDDAHWNVIACTDTQKCNAKLKTCVDLVVTCTDDENYCTDDNVYMYCKGGIWREKACKEGYICTPDKGCVKPSVFCDESDSHCKPEDNVLAECIKGEWYYTYCGDKGLICDPTSLSCVEEITECKSGTVKCSDDLSTLMMCDGGVWKYDYCKDYGLVCDPEKLICTGGIETCKEGARKCADSGTSMICKDNIWYKEPCRSDQICNSATGYCENIYIECKDGDKECLSDYSGYKYCKDGTWVKRACKDGLVCDPETVTCLEKPLECKDGERYCYDSSTIRYCKGGTWYYEKCEEGYCEKETAQCVTSTECKVGEQYCSSSSTLVVCEDGHWTKTECPESAYCDGTLNKCVSIFECKDGDKYCSSSTSLMVCKEGKWIEEICSKSQYCDKDAAACVDYYVECKDGEFYCNDSSTLVTCEGGKWRTTICGKSQYCDKTSGTCVDYITDCTPGDVQCYDDYNLKICGKDSKWYISACSSSTPYCYVGMNACVECIPGDTTCKDDMTALNCNRSGKWVAYYCSESQICNAGVCEDIFSECKDGEAYCSDYSTSVYCVGGRWVKDYCNKSEYCNKYTGLCEPAVTECEEGSIKCSDDVNALMMCKEGKWSLYEYCAKTQMCMDNMCVDILSPECVDGQRKCDGQISYYCKDNQWFEDKICDRGQVCNDKVGSICIPYNGICTEPSYSCIGNNINKCYNGLYEVGEYCKEGYCSVKGDDPYEQVAYCLDTCSPGSIFCSADYSQILSCNSMGLGTEVVEKCGKMRCVESNDGSKPSCEKFICNENEVFCGDDTNPNVLYGCKNNKRIELANCKDYGMVCKLGECLY